MLKLVAAALLSFGILSCARENGEKELPASIKQIIAANNCTCEPYINLYNWKGQQVYLLASTGPACNWIPFYYNAKGERIEMPAGYTLDQFWADSQIIKTVWRCTAPAAPAG